MCSITHVDSTFLRLNKLPFLDPREEVEALEGLKAGSIGVRWGNGLRWFAGVADLDSVGELDNNSFPAKAGRRAHCFDTERALENEQFTGFPIVNNGVERFVVGYIGREDLKFGLGG